MNFAKTAFYEVRKKVVINLSPRRLFRAHHKGSSDDCLMRCIGISVLMLCTP